ncbi:MAG: fumarate hydratase [Eubacteriales bacterium]|jgi:fumarate hydratase subunit alpha|nr:fumarate hydratase [Eubacteriales bacterium]
MRKIKAKEIADVVSRLCAEANYYICDDIKRALEAQREIETHPRARNVIDKLLENAQIAKNEEIAICQDTGMAVVFVEIGQEVYVEGSLEDAINQGVREGYEKGYLRKSVVKDPLDRINTGDNTPAVIHYEIVPGDSLKITVAPKGFGSENMSGVKMLKPSDGEAGILDFVVETVYKGGGNPCPPIVVGVGIGGTMEKAALLAKKALLLPVDHKNPNTFYANMEEALLKKINRLGIGPMGWGGDTTALGVNILTYPTHIAGLPVAVNIGCHVTRHASAVI